MKKCKQCGHELKSYSPKYYCCNKQELFCTMCSSNKCPKCLKTRWQRLKPPQCAKCYDRVDQETGFKDKTCGKYFCSRCLVKCFNPTYSNSFKLDPFYHNDLKKPISLFCGHQCQFSDLQDYFRNFCVDCGKQYRKTIDYQLKDGVKICYSCYSYLKDKYKQNLISCVSCERTIDNPSKAGISGSQGLILCQSCVRQSELSEMQLEKSRKLNESRKMQDSKYKEKQFQKPQQISNKKVSQNHKIIKEQQKSFEEVSSLIHQKTQPQKRENDVLPEKDKSIQISKQELQKIEKFEFYSPHKQSYPVINKIIDEMQEGDEEMRKSLGLKKKPLLKKHLSGHTIVENLQVEITLNKVQEFVSCKQCKCKVSTKIAYDLNPSSSSKIKSSNIISISAIESLRSDKEENSFICRVCYFKKVEENKKQKKDLLLSQRKVYEDNFLLNEGSRSNGYSKVQSSVNRMTRSICNSPYKDYGLTGHKLQQKNFTTERKQSARKQEKYTSKIDSLLMKDYERLKQSSSYSSRRLFEKDQPIKKCLMCGASNKKLAASASRQSFYCLDCLSLYNPYGYTRAQKLIY